MPGSSAWPIRPLIDAATGDFYALLIAVFALGLAAGVVLAATALHQNKESQ